MEKKEKIIIVGAGSMAKEVVDLSENMTEFEIIGFVIDQPPHERGTLLDGKPIFWIDELEEYGGSYKALCAIASANKERLVSKLEDFGVEFINFVHTTAYVSRTTKFGKGIVITNGVQIAAHCSLGDFVFINRGSLIGHDVEIGKYCVVSPGVNIGGNVKIGSHTYIGMGAIILEGVNIGAQSFIGAGSLVTRDVPDRVKVVGSPAKVIERDFHEF